MSVIILLEKGSGCEGLDNSRKILNPLLKFKFDPEDISVRVCVPDNYKKKQMKVIIIYTQRQQFEFD